MTGPRMEVCSIHLNHQFITSKLKNKEKRIKLNLTSQFKLFWLPQKKRAKTLVSQDKKNEVVYAFCRSEKTKKNEQLLGKNNLRIHFLFNIMRKNLWKSNGSKMLLILFFWHQKLASLLFLLSLTFWSKNYNAFDKIVQTHFWHVVVPWFTS